MAKYVAKQPTSNVVLQGLGILANPRGVRFDDVSKSGFTASTQSGITLEVGGHGFKKTFLGAGQPKAVGTVTDIKYSVSGTLFYKLSDAEYPFRDLAESSDSAKHTKAIFAGNDVLKGSFGNDTLKGFKGNDRIDGKDGNDTLYGDGGKDTLGGGKGADNLDGGKGKDTYVFKADPITGIDTIVKFQKDEQIHLKAKFFAGLEPGDLLEEQFVIGMGPLDAEDRIIYNPATGYLYHDPDGAAEGGLAPVIFAKMQAGLDHLGAENFLII